MYYIVLLRRQSVVHLKYCFHRCQSEAHYVYRVRKFATRVATFCLSIRLIPKELNVTCFLRLKRLESTKNRLIEP